MACRGSLHSALLLVTMITVFLVLSTFAHPIILPQTREAGQPHLPESFSATVLQVHYDAESKSTRTRKFIVYQDYALRRQRVETIIAFEEGLQGGQRGEYEGGNHKNATVISYFGRSWGDDCGGNQVLIESFFERSVCYSMALPDTACMRADDFAPAATFPLSKYRFKPRGSAHIDGIAVDIWHASLPPTACPNAATVAVRKGSLTAVVAYNVSNDCSHYQHSFVALDPSSPSSAVFPPLSALTCTPTDMEDQELVNSPRRVAVIAESASGAGWRAGPSARMANLKVMQARQQLAGTRLRGASFGLEQRGAGGEGGAAPLPREFDARRAWAACAHVIGHVQDQGTCGCCWAMAAASALSDRFCIASLNATAPAPATVHPPRETARFRSAEGLGLSGVERQRAPRAVRERWHAGGSGGAEADDEERGGGWEQGWSGRLSVEYLMSCDEASDGCDGGFVDAAWDFMRDHGIDSAACTPYRQISLPKCPQQCSNRDGRHNRSDVEHSGPAASLDVDRPGRPHPSIKPGVQLGGAPHGAQEGRLELFRTSDAYSPGSDPVAIQREILSHGPVEAAFWVYSDFLNYNGGVYRRTSKDVIGGHAVKIIGWGEEATEEGGAEGEEGKKRTRDRGGRWRSERAGGGRGGGGGGGRKFWLVVNSWGKDWGEGGLFRIERGANECGIEDEVGAGTPLRG